MQLVGLGPTVGGRALGNLVAIPRSVATRNLRVGVSPVVP